MIHSMFSGLCKAEARAREAIILATIGLDKLANIEAVTIPVPFDWNLEQIVQVGRYLLYLSYKSFVCSATDRIYTGPKVSNVNM